MSEIPERIYDAASKAWMSVPTAEWEQNAAEIIARAILAERDRCVAICREIGKVHNDGYFDVPDLIANVIEDKKTWP